MNNLSYKKIFLIFVLNVNYYRYHVMLSFQINPVRNAEKGLFGKSIGNKKEVKLKEPRKCCKGKKETGSQRKKT